MSWEAPSYNSKERATAHVLRALLGGGRSFESGGAGKGLTTILYRVLGSLVGQNFSAFKVSLFGCSSFVNCSYFRRFIASLKILEFLGFMECARKKTLNKDIRRVLMS